MAASQGSRRAFHARGSPDHTQPNALAKEVLAEWICAMEDFLGAGKIPYDPMTPEQWGPGLRKYGYDRVHQTLEWIENRSCDELTNIRERAKSFTAPIKRCIFIRDNKPLLGPLLCKWMSVRFLPRALAEATFDVTDRAAALLHAHDVAMAIRQGVEGVWEHTWVIFDFLESRLVFDVEVDSEADSEGDEYESDDAGEEYESDDDSDGSDDGDDDGDSTDGDHDPGIRSWEYVEYIQTEILEGRQQPLHTFFKPQTQPQTKPFAWNAQAPVFVPGGTDSQDTTYDTPHGPGRTFVQCTVYSSGSEVGEPCRAVQCTDTGRDCIPVKRDTQGMVMSTIPVVEAAGGRCTDNKRADDARSPRGEHSLGGQRLFEEGSTGFVAERGRGKTRKQGKTGTDRQTSRDRVLARLGARLAKRMVSNDKRKHRTTHAGNECISARRDAGNHRRLSGRPVATQGSTSDIRLTDGKYREDDGRPTVKRVKSDIRLTDGKYRVADGQPKDIRQAYAALNGPRGLVWRWIRPPPTRDKQPNAGNHFTNFHTRYGFECRGIAK